MDIRFWSSFRQNMRLFLCIGCYTPLAQWNQVKNEDLATADKIAVARIERGWNLPDTQKVELRNPPFPIWLPVQAGFLLVRTGIIVPSHTTPFLSMMIVRVPVPLKTGMLPTKTRPERMSKMYMTQVKSIIMKTRVIWSISKEIQPRRTIPGKYLILI